MKHITAALAAAAALVCALPATAQEQQPAFTWQQVTITGGCIITVPTSEPVPEGVTMTWDHTCTPGQAISGDGTIRLQTTDGRSVTLLANWIAGVPNGPVTMTAFDAAGAQPGQRTGEYNMGCVVGPNVTCVPYRPG